jgi:hypothetical protein
MYLKVIDDNETAFGALDCLVISNAYTSSHKSVCIVQQEFPTWGNILGACILGMRTGNTQVSIG